jgi:hypothetical protein
MKIKSCWQEPKMTVSFCRTKFTSDNNLKLVFSTFVVIFTVLSRTVKKINKIPKETAEKFQQV